MNYKKINNLLEIIKQQIQNNRIQGYKNLLFLYYNLIEIEDNTILLDLFNIFIKELFDKNIILTENNNPEEILLSSRCWNPQKIDNKKRILEGELTFND